MPVTESGTYHPALIDKIMRGIREVLKGNLTTNEQDSPGAELPEPVAWRQFDGGHFYYRTDRIDDPRASALYSEATVRSLVKRLQHANERVQSLGRALVKAEQRTILLDGLVADLEAKLATRKEASNG